MGTEVNLADAMARRREAVRAPSHARDVLVVSPTGRVVGASLRQGVGERVPVLITPANSNVPPDYDDFVPSSTWLGG